MDKNFVERRRFEFNSPLERLKFYNENKGKEILGDKVSFEDKHDIFLLKVYEEILN